MGGCCLSLHYPNRSVTIYQELLVSGQFSFNAITKYSGSIVLKSRPVALKMATGSLESSAVLYIWACSLCKLRVYTRGLGGYSTLVLLKKQLAIPALKPLECIKNTGQTSTGFRTCRAWPQESISPDAERSRAHQLLYWWACAFTSYFSPLSWRAEHLFFPQSLGTSIYTLTWLLHLFLGC